MKSWIAEAPTDPEGIREAEKGLDEFKRNMNANRAATGERLPDPGVAELVTTVFLDSGPRGLLTNANRPPAAVACLRWAVDMMTAGHRFVVPSIADYEVRRELERAGKVNGRISGRLECRVRGPLPSP